MHVHAVAHHHGPGMPLADLGAPLAAQAVRPGGGRLESGGAAVPLGTAPLGPVRGRGGGGGGEEPGGDQARGESAGAGKG